MAKKKKFIGIMGGTFDPVHVGHLVVAEEARAQFKLDEVVFIPSGTPPHKKDYHVTPAEVRYKMTLLATAGNPSFSVSRVEIDREGPSYAVDTLRELKKRYADSTQFYFITGLDAILEILTWKDPEHVFRLCHFIAATRPGFHAEDVKKKFHGRKEILRKVRLLSVPALAISSSDIRRRVSKRMTVKYLLPESVENYIYKHHLYRKVSPNGKRRSAKFSCQNPKSLS